MGMDDTVMGWGWG